MSRFSSQRFDVHQEVTNRIVDALEHAGEFQLPWIANTATRFARPVNVASRKPYNGVNIVSLWVAAQASDYPSNVWGTYRQWQEAGCQVRRQEKSSLVVFYKTFDAEQINDQTGEAEQGERKVLRASWVFNAAQVDGYPLDQVDIPDLPAFDPIARAEAFVAATGAVIEEAGDKACYVPSADIIRMPERRRFMGTTTTSPAEGFYSTLCHELTHWAGAKGRLSRDLSGRFGTEAYAMEELVAELGAAFLCGDLGLVPEPRLDHAQYIKHWLTVMKSDKKAVFTAASKASEASTWLMSLSSSQRDIEGAA
ncbi:DUF1738 domain-containing protein (plasmid) [Rhizobium rosettiformans]|uniref:DUF1738 domain-containing protein n=1 Tax=Rhizobium rosettiformans TaxID=1368430 RepID=A0ABX7F555_9HYPH|nr:zincin-like metallopeptidase domain-containing protein [Rhizobium rosettiformans]QRF54501.1 DUF1738 domain-containing protein [Rhizobium rosettiformans]